VTGLNNEAQNNEYRTAEIEDEDGESKEGRSLECKGETLSLQACTFSMEECKRQNAPVQCLAKLLW
jgi:hypothetical protein